MPFLVVVDGVTDPQNLGALLRSAECAGVTGVVLPRAPERARDTDGRQGRGGRGGARPNRGRSRHSGGASGAGAPRGLGRRSRRARPEPVFRLRLEDRPIALVIGAEGRGLATLARQRCDVLVQIPLHGSIESLNVSAAGAVAMFEVARQRVAGQA